jgi:tetratricopeptide (TPR) repeat protein
VIWSDLIEVGRASVQHIRRELVARLANALDLELHSEEARRLAMLAASSPEAVDLLMQGRAAGGYNWSRAHHEQALAYFERTLALDPDNVEALGWRASTLVLLNTAWPGPDIAQQLARAEADVQRALSIDSLDARNYRTLSMLRNQQYRLNDAIEAVETALELNPNDARAWSFRGELQRYAGRSELAFEPLERALRLSPRDPHRWLTHLRLGMAAVSLGDHARALPWLDRAWALNAHWTIPPFRAAACIRTGELERAFELQPLYSPEGLLHRQWMRVSGHPVFFSQLREHLCRPLVEAGLVADYSGFDDWAARQRRGGL